MCVRRASSSFGASTVKRWKRLGKRFGERVEKRAERKRGMTWRARTATLAEDALQDALLGDIGGSETVVPTAGTSRKRARVSQVEDEDVSASAAGAGGDEGIDHIFLTRICAETAGGLPGLLLTLAGINEVGMTGKLKDYKEGGQAVKFDTFHGTHDKLKALLFLQQFDAAFAGGNFTEASKIRKAATFLKINAPQWWTTMLNQGVVPSTWVQFKKIFAPAWITNTFEVDVMTAWNQLSAINCESLEEYNAKFWDALLPVSSFKIVPLAEQIEKYCCGLPKGIKKYCTKTSVMNMAQLMENAEVADDLIHGKPDEVGFKTRRKEPQGKQFSAKGNVTSRLTVPPFKKKPFVGSKPFAGNRPFNTENRCNAENQRFKPPSFSGQRQGFKRHFTGKTIEERKALRDARKCYICEEEGHFANECPQRNSQNKDDKSDRKGKKPKPSVGLVPDLAQIWGPGEFQHLVNAIRCFVPSAATLHTHSFGGESYEMGDDEIVDAVAGITNPIMLLENELVKISAVVLQSKQSSDVPNRKGATRVSVIYICELTEVLGKFDPKKAFARGLRPGPKYGKLQKGESVISDDGRQKVNPEDVLGPSSPGPIMILVDCPDASFLHALISIPSMQLYYSGSGKTVNCIVHLSPPSVTSDEGYQKWMAKFSDAHHLMAGRDGKNPGLPILKSSANQLSKLNFVCPDVFPMSGFLEAEQQNLTVQHFNAKHASIIADYDGELLLGRLV
ncbi:hypothetical protein L7F22_068479 [Adiantum nelumboides]|nr:hypothetical protein [Adiantum nelumboides]